MIQSVQLSLFDNPVFFESYKKHTSVSLEVASLFCIQNTLKQLYADQHEDVKRAEKRFFVDNGKGILFTNGTGTGKTYVGLGIAKRFFLRNKSNILIVVPSDQKAKDWIEDGKNIKLKVNQVQSISDSGKNIVVATYANFYQNEALLNRHFDLIIYDESHYLCQSESGKETEYLVAHRKVANLPSMAKIKAENQLPPKPSAPIQPKYPNRWDNNYKEELEIYEILYKQYLLAYDDWTLKLNNWKAKYDTLTKSIVDNTKVVFLSATPFSYHKNLIYGDGTLWDIYETLDVKDSYSGYNEASGLDSMLTEHFGYRMRYNKPNKPESGVDVNFLERNFYENMVKKGIVSGRQLQVENDYSRDFILLDEDNLSERINDGMKLFFNFDNKDFSDRYKNLKMVVSRKWNYLYISQLLEAIKAHNIVPRIKQHLELGRKVVVFHGYNNGIPSHPFHFNAYLLTNSEERQNGFIGVLKREIEQFEAEYPELYNLDLNSLNNVKSTLKEAFSNFREFNGTITKKKRFDNLKAFNKKYSGIDIIGIQRKAGKEGISLHDVNGDCQRVLIDLGLPTAPSDAIQTEGRIYRLGVQSNAIFEYPVLHTDFERRAFADKVAARARTAENLAMGMKARNLEDSFIFGYKNATEDVPHLNQGTGGKEFDKAVIDNNISEFQKAITYYYARGSKTAKNKSKEGLDYYATPEPLGLKMVEWLNLQPNDDACEPSAGHGAIARFFGEYTNNTFIEPSFTLASQLALNVKGNIKQHVFEDFHTINKFNGIAMNPPFGKAGAMALEHVKKALSHLKQYGRVVALIPNSQSMERRLYAFLNEKDLKGKLVNSDITVRMEIILPQCTFKRAGTMVGTKILIIDKVSNNDFNDMKEVIDLSYCDDSQQLFDRIEYLEAPERFDNYNSIAC